MKKGFNILFVVFVVLVGISCNKTKSYTDYLKDERKMIDRLMDENGFYTRDDFPSDTVFKENEFVKLDNGVYMNVIYKGNGEKAIVGKTNILFRSKGAELVSLDSMTNFDTFWNGGELVVFKYGTTLSTNSYSIEYEFLSPGINIPLDYLSDSCEVKLIVPFAQGSSYAMTKYRPFYFERARYVFEK